LLIYLFGASPAACKCFVEGRDHNLEEFDKTSLYLPGATCLRMGNLGYKSEAQESLFVCYNDLPNYVESLHRAMHTTYPEYAEIGQQRDGEHLQINTSLLQLENEFYSTIRPKRNAKNGERPLDALTNSGIEYVEVRALDLDPYSPLGISAEQIRFLDTFLLHCLLTDSPQCDEVEYLEVASNLSKVVEHGRDSKLLLNKESTPITLKKWSLELLSDMAHSAGLFDEMHSDSKHSDALSQQLAKTEDPSLTPSGRMLTEMTEREMSFFDFSIQQSKKHQAYFSNNGLDEKTLHHMHATAAESLDKQLEIEKTDEIDFDQFLKKWNAA